MNHVPSIWSFISGADALVKGVLLILLTASVFSWALIIKHRRALTRCFGLLDQFESRFWSGLHLPDLHEKLGRQRATLHPMEAIFESGFTQYQQQTQGAVTIRLDAIARAMQATQSRCMGELSGRSDWLATIGSISPYVGLFGTVWGIMSAFRSLGGVQQASIAMVAPGIAEALIATAIGLLVAIPAVVAYNRFTSTLEKMESRLTNFQDDLLNVLQRELSQEDAHA